jgi:hypothetical protein
MVSPTTTPQVPLISATPSDARRMWPALSSMLRAFALKDENLLPAKVISYDRVNNIATVQPMILLVKTDGTTMNRNPIAMVPVLSLGGGGFHINFPLVKDSLGWIFAADRDMSLFQQTLALSPPNTTRCHKFSDGMFIPDVFFKYTINEADADAMVIQSVDGTTRISMSEGIINLTAPTSMTVTTPIATFTQDVMVKGNLTITGNTAANGGLDTTGGGSSAPVTLSENTTTGGLPVYGHNHMGNGAGQYTGPMLN